MSKQSLLLVDGDTRSLRVLEVSLRKAGFTVTPAASVSDALDKLALDTPDLIISETKFPTDLDGFELRRRVRGSPDWAEIPFVFLTAETAIEHKIRGLELGVDDYLTKPIYIKEIVTRINILLQKRQRAHFDERKDGVRFAGRVADMPVVDVIQTIEVSRKSGVIQFVADRHRTAAIYFRDGKVIDAEAGTLQGEDAVYRLLTWSEGEFEVVFRTVRRREVIQTSSQGLLMEGMRRLDEWSRLLEQLPPLTHRFEIDTTELAGRLGEVPDDNNPILRLIDGKRSLLEIIDASDFGDLECLQAVSRLFFEGLLVDLDPEQRPKRDTGKPMPLVIVESTPTPIEKVASGPLAIPRDEPEPAPAAADDTNGSGSVEVAESEVLSEEDLPGPLMGGYRKSSLHKIDEAVAAAQAIDPSLFESDLVAAPPEPMQLARVQVKQRESDPRIANARGVIEKHDLGRPKTKSVPPAIKDAILRADASAEILLPTDAELSAFATPEVPPEEPRRSRADRSGDEGSDPIHVAAPTEEITDEDSGIPTAIESEDESSGHFGEDDHEEPTEPERPPYIARRDPSGLRMTSSHGHDRAETSGELHMAPRTKAEPRVDQERELVTILPRRITREVPITGDAVGAADSQLSRLPAEPPGAMDDDLEDETTLPGQLPPPRRYSVAGGVRRTTGPGPLVTALVVIASLMAGMAIYLYVHKHRQRAQVAVAHDASVPMITIDATQLVVEPLDAASPPDAARVVVAPPDAAVHVAAVIDAAPPPPRPDAAVQVAGADAGIDRNKEAARLKDEAASALADGDTDRALELADQSLKLRRTAQAYLVQARALQRSGRTDDAIASATSARDLAPGYYATHHELGMILMAARRNAEARPELEKYLELAPNDKDAETVRQLLSAPAP